MFLIPKGSRLYDRPNSQLLALEPVLFINVNICGPFWGKIGGFGRNWPEKRTLATGAMVALVHAPAVSLWHAGTVTSEALTVSSPTPINSVNYGWLRPHKHIFGPLPAEYHRLFSMLGGDLHCRHGEAALNVVSLAQHTGVSSRSSTVEGFVTISSVSFGLIYPCGYNCKQIQCKRELRLVHTTL
jgi:hypothetical protein